MVNIKTLKREPLSPEQLQNFYESVTGEQLKVVYWNNIADNETIDSLFSGNHIVLFIPVNSETDGHFISMFRNGKGIHWNDSYAHTPKELYNNITNMGHVKLSTKLLDLLRASNEPVYSNRVLYQTLSSEVSNCGRYSVACCLWNNEYVKAGIDFDLDAYHSKILDFMRSSGAHRKTNNYKDYDDAITKITEYLK